MIYDVRIHQKKDDMREEKMYRRLIRMQYVQKHSTY